MLACPLRLTTEDTAVVGGTREYDHRQEEIGESDSSAEDEKAALVPAEEKNCKGKGGRGGFIFAVKVEVDHHLLGR